MKRIGIILGTETSPIEGHGKEFKQYYKKHKKHFDTALQELELDNLEDLSYDIQIFALLKKNAPSNVEVVPLWKLEYTKKDLDSLDLVFGLYEFTYALQDYGFEGVTKYLNLMRTTKAVVCPNYKLQKFVMNKQAYTNYLRKHNFPVLDTMFFNIDLYKKDKREAKKLYDKITKKFDGPVFCKPELGGFAKGTKLFKKITLKSLEQYLTKLIKLEYKKLLIQSYIGEFLKYHEIKTIWVNGKFQYAYGMKVTSEEGGILKQSDIDKELLKELTKKGKEIIKRLTIDFGLPFLLRIDWGCCLPNDNLCRDYFVNEIEVFPAMVSSDAPDHDAFDRLSKELLKKLK